MCFAIVHFQCGVFFMWLAFYIYIYIKVKVIIDYRNPKNERYIDLNNEYTNID